jgi:phosphonoacetaldehyde hydrolase
VCVGDTAADIRAGLNAGIWTVGVTRTGNLVGLSEAEWDRLSQDQQDERLDQAETQLKAAGAHYVIDSFSRLPAVITQLERELKHGQAPFIPRAR